MTLMLTDSFYAQPALQMEKMKDIDSRQLMEKGENWLDKGMGDSALICFSVLASRYDKSNTLEEKQLAVRAVRGKWLVYFTYLYDYPKAYESVYEALDICEKENFDKSMTYISLAAMLHVMADQGGSKDLYDDAFKYYKQGFEEGLKRKNYDLVDIAFVNMISAAKGKAQKDTLAECYAQYMAAPTPKDYHRKNFSKSLFTAMESQTLSPEEGMEEMISAVKRLPEIAEYNRLKYIGLENAAELGVKGGRYAQARDLALEARDHAIEKGLKDAEMEVYKLLSQIYDHLGNKEESSDYFDKYLRIKEEMIGSRLVQQLDELRFLTDMRKANEEIIAMKEQHRRNMLIIIFLLVLVAVVGVSIWMIAINNSKLKQAYRTLYHQYMDKIKSESNIDNKKEKLALDSAEEEEDIDDVNVIEEGKGENREEKKNLTSHVNDELRSKIISGIEMMVRNTDFICNSDCSVNSMAHQIGCNPKYLSQVINTEYGCNFNMLINKYRIMEAARRLSNDKEWEKITIEGIANSVGFKSRSSFINMFKHFTGMTPSIYKKMVVEEKSHI